MGLDVDEPVETRREDARQGLPGRKEPERPLRGNLPVEKRHELVSAGRAVQPRVQVLEQPGRDLPIAVELVQRPEQERLVNHGRQQRVGHLVPRRVEHGDARPVAATPQSIHDRRRSPRFRLGDSRLQVVTLLEIDVDEVVASHRAAQGTGASPDVEPGQPRHLSRFRHEPVGDLLEVPQLLGGDRRQVARVRSTHRTAPESRLRDGTSTHHGLTKNRRCTRRDARRWSRLSGRGLHVDQTPGASVCADVQPDRPSDALPAREPLPGEADPRRQAVWNRSVRVPALDGDSAMKSSRARGRLKCGRTVCNSGRLTALPAADAALCHEVARATPILARAMRFGSVPAEAVNTERNRYGSGGRPGAPVGASETASRPLRGASSRSRSTSKL